LTRTTQNIGLYLGILLLFAGVSCANGQETKIKKSADTTVVRSHSPHKATLLSLIPGAGQIYNKKYWKLPIVYAGFAVTGYFGVTKGQEYRKYRDAYICSAALGADCTNPLAEKYTAEDLQTIRDDYRRNMELSYIIMGAWYVIQILDATVDAHLYYWEVNDNLSVRVDPMIESLNMYPASPIMPANLTPNGLRVTVSF
jgi:hypothetical protein